MDVNIWRYIDRYEWIDDGWKVGLGNIERRDTRVDRSIWEYNSYRRPYPPKTLGTFRLTSPTVKEEYECWFLRTRQFAFRSPPAYHVFMKKLTAEQQGWIRSVRIEIMPDCVRPFLSDPVADRAWMAICDELPTTLRVVNLLIDRGVFLKSPDFLIRCWSRGREKVPTVGRIAELLSTLRKRILRRIPGVETHLGGWNDNVTQEDKATIQRAWDEDVDL